LWFADPTSYHDLFFLQNLLHTTRIDPDMLLRRALPAAHFDRNATTPVTDLVHQYQAISAPPRSAQQQCHPAPGDKNICLIGPLIVSEKQTSQNGIGVVRNSCVSSAPTCTW